ncbi:16S rRNA (guanine(966)-N(2))-methyltransferase RsmD [Mobiluncus mulieris]|uniref:Ribosomal RNA small subunit methyltransferase D n=1 Tax=Mobiluncus mulieris TaxID=2052 RepID=A0A2J9KRC8_9ACTO|nr:16S rRNA (guanine(966)-N(2))-methyltransferase RsmD [Mobiluncus mulieris]EFN93066.1 RNA methyltransferase, RsmD family [Mobiluncus mulieris FB024-16]MBB5846219.1 16S rRNA (guanine966-N2)-methyltransferase [Mobiluncus mulieris]MCU9996200.1 16S rRNA (guanine(966)-N(2))-methyltransferase RsmD [Mobiluncus mulieris]MCV0001606.1 16S rRNA (guanine(966)-N(2))-methyltransferase RsmD [Mobiluncus mulieris]MCV0012870.1 16S rRNA (guanine(966)-N(2))-methyltransferase RsmD [Mobiluncus mulieris]
MTRIVAGAWGGRVLQVPRSGTRPTSERVREAIFSRLDSQGVIAGARVLDIFAGSGALGLEALSRGATDAMLVDSARGAVQVLRANAAALSAGERVQVVGADAVRFAASLGANERFDLVFIDPPYALDSGILDQVLSSVATHLAPAGIIILESSSRAVLPDLPPQLMNRTTKTYGDTQVSFLEVAPKN